MGNGQFIMVFYQNLLIQLKQIRRNIILIVLPIVVFFFVALFFNFNEVAGEFLSPIYMAVIDEDNTMYTDMLIESFRNNEEFSTFVHIVEGSDEALWASFEAGEIDAMIQVPEGFVANMSEQAQLPVKVMINYNDPVKAVLFKNVIVGYEKYIRSVQTGIYMFKEEMDILELDQDLKYAYTDRIFVNLIFTALARQTYFDYHEIVNVPTTVAVKYYFIALVVMFMMYLSIFSAINLIREKEKMCLRRFRITQIGFFKYLSAKALANTTYMFMVVGIWYLLYYIFFGRLTEGAMFATFMFAIVCIFFNVSLSLMSTIFFDSEEPIVLLSSIFIFINAILGGSIIPIHSMSFVIQRIAKVTPNYWMIKGFLFIDSAYKTEEIFFVACGLIVISFMMLLITSLKYSKKEA